MGVIATRDWSEVPVWELWNGVVEDRFLIGKLGWVVLGLFSLRLWVAARQLDSLSRDEH